MGNPIRITNDLKQQLAEIFKLSGLNSHDFDLIQDFSEFTLKYKFDYFSFYINRNDSENFYTTIFAIESKEGSSRLLNWSDLKIVFENWLKGIFFELKGQSGWEGFGKENFIYSNYSELEEEFTQTEKEQINAAINEIKEKIKNLDIPLESLKILDSKLDNLNTKVDILNKFDWKSLFAGTIVSLTLTLGIPPEVNGILTKYINEAFSFLKSITK
jgi:hypothetical protein